MAATAPAPRAEAARLSYPSSRAEAIVDTLHGVPVPDPYRWLEIGESAQVQAWVEAQNALTRAFLDSLPARRAIHDRLQELLSIGTISAPVARGGRYFFEKREGLQNQAVLYVRSGLAGQTRPLLDPNQLSAEGTTALDWWYVSRDGRRVAYGLSEDGSEMSTLRVRDADNGRELPDVIPDTRGCSLEWTREGDGFYYTRYPGGEEGSEEGTYRRRVYFHALGTDPAGDPLVFGEGLELTDWTNVDLSPDGRHLLATVYKSSTRSDLYVRDLLDGERFVPIIRGEAALFTGEIVGDTIYITTNWKAPKQRVLRAALCDAGPDSWREIIPEGEDALQSATIVGRRILAEYLNDASSRLRLFDLEGHRLAEVPLPAIGTVYGIDGVWDGQEAFFGFHSYFVPPAAYRFDLPRGTVEEFERISFPFDPSGYEIERVRFASKDGALIPMFVVHKRGLVRDGRNPVVLAGYGGFNVSMTPTFARNSFLWLESGGVYAVPNLRGGGEFGEGWHQAGMLGRKQSTFDDFLAAAEWLIAEGYTSPERLAIWGGSNGGLLVGAAITQRPDLFRAAVCDVPLLDMVRYERFRVARLWTSEYGSSSDPDQFRFLFAYSPYHHVRGGEAYPAVLFTAAESDARVDPLHARKMTARLQGATASERPVLLRQETEAGHGQGKPLGRLLEELTDSWSFVFHELRAEPRTP